VNGVAITRSRDSQPLASSLNTKRSIAGSLSRARANGSCTGYSWSAVNPQLPFYVSVHFFVEILLGGLRRVATRLI
jgi:hypothetical protein